MTWWERLDEFIVQMPCPYCKARAHEWCKTKSGASYRYLHTKRGDALRKLSADAYDDGWRDGRDYQARVAMRQAQQRAT